MISEESPSRAEGLFSTVSNDAGYFVGSVPGLSTPQYAAATPILVVPLPPTSTLHIALPSDTLATAGPPIATVAPWLRARLLAGSFGGLLRLLRF
jgi:hypothetical protein